MRITLTIACSHGRHQTEHDIETGDDLMRIVAEQTRGMCTDVNVHFAASDGDDKALLVLIMEAFPLEPSKFGAN